MKPHTYLRRALTWTAALVTSVTCLTAVADPQTPEPTGAPPRPAAGDNASRSTKRTTYPC